MIAAQAYSEIPARTSRRGRRQRVEDRVERQPDADEAATLKKSAFVTLTLRTRPDDWRTKSFWRCRGRRGGVASDKTELPSRRDVAGAIVGRDGAEYRPSAISVQAHR